MLLNNKFHLLRAYVLQGIATITIVIMI